MHAASQVHLSSARRYTCATTSCDSMCFGSKVSSTSVLCFMAEANTVDHFKFNESLVKLIHAVRQCV